MITSFLALSLLAYLVYFTMPVPDMSDMSARVQHKQRECNTSETSATRMQHVCQTSCGTNYTSARRVKNFDFDDDTNKNIFTPLYLLHGK